MEYQSIKIYRHLNPYAGFNLQQVNLTSMYMDEQVLMKLLDYINKQILICVNRQSTCLFNGQVDEHSIVNQLALFILLPVVISLVFNCYAYLLWEYCLVFLFVGYKMFKEFQKSNQMSEQYCQAGEQLDQQFGTIMNQFNNRFSHIQMSYHKQIEVEKRDYLQIRVTNHLIQLKKLKQKIDLQIMENSIKNVNKQ